MRIRKNAKLFSSILPSHASPAPEALQTHVCQLNQSPWDVVPLEYSCASLNYQFEGEDSFTGNGSFGDSVGAGESVASMMDGDDNKAEMMSTVDDEMVIDDNENAAFEGHKMEDQFGLGGNGDYKATTRCCVKTDGKGWHCRNQPEYGHDLCGHHLFLQQQQLKSYSNNNKKHDKAVAVDLCSRSRGRARAANKKGSLSNPYEFYYYSGFGPSWGKRRGDRVIADGKKCETDNKDSENNHTNSPGNNDHKTTSSSSQIENDEFDFVDDDEDDDEDDCGKKRTRKPVKARSLKSLM